MSKLDIDDPRDKLREDTLESLRRIQEFDVASLPRKKELGIDLSFTDAVVPAERLIGIYKKITLSCLDDLPPTQLNQILSQANANYGQLVGMLKFSQKEANAYENRNNLIQTIKNAYQASFTKLFPLINYSASKSTDFQGLELEARTMIQDIQGKGEKLRGESEATLREAKQTLQEAQNVAAEQGVSQQAHYFKDEASGHSTAAFWWLVATILLTGGLVATAFAFIKWNVEIDVNDSKRTYAIVQLAVSKLLVFATVSFLLGLSAKNYRSNKHNQVINKHRENALKTYQALVKAAGDDANRDIVLTKAAACIFEAQTTGFDKGESPEGKALSMLNISPGTLNQIAES